MADSPIIQLKLINGPTMLAISAGPGLPVRRFARGKVTIVNDADEARALVNAIKRKDRRYVIVEVSEGSVFDLGYDCGVEPSPNFKAGLAGLLVGETPAFQNAFNRLLAAGTAALAPEAGDESGGADEPPQAPPEAPAKGTAKGKAKPAGDESGGGKTVTSDDVPKAGE